MDWNPIVVSSLIGVVVAACISWAFYRAQQQTDFYKIQDNLDKGLEKTYSYMKEIVEQINSIRINTIEEIRKSSLESSRLTKDNDNNLKLLSEKLNIVSNNTASLNRDAHIEHQKYLNKIDDRIGILAEQIYSIKVIENLSKDINIAQEMSHLRNNLESLNSTINDMILKGISDIQEQQKIMLKEAKEQYIHNSMKSKEHLESELHTEIRQKLPSYEGDILLKNLMELFMNAMSGIGEFQQQNVNHISHLMISNLEKKWIYYLFRFQKR